MSKLDKLFDYYEVPKGYEIYHDKTLARQYFQY